MIFGIIGLGLLGGSFSYSLKKHSIASKVIGFDTCENNSKQALELGIVDELCSIDKIAQQANVIVIATPVDFIADIAINVLDNTHNSSIIIDLGSTKEKICKRLKNHQKRRQFVATHPMWGTENSGPSFAQKDAFVGNSLIICEKEISCPKALQTVEDIYKKIGMNIIYMSPQNHDLHCAYISHISHISSFCLALATLKKEKQKNNYIKELASAGFSSTARLAKSSPITWSSIFIENKDNVLDVLDEYIEQIQYFKNMIKDEDKQSLISAMTEANDIKRII